MDVTRRLTDSRVIDGFLHGLRNDFRTKAYKGSWHSVKVFVGVAGNYWKTFGRGALGKPEVEAVWREF